MLRIIKLIVLVIMVTAGIWARKRHTAATDQLTETQMTVADAIQGNGSQTGDNPFISRPDVSNFGLDLSGFGPGGESSKPKYTPPPTVTPSEVQENPYLK